MGLRLKKQLMYFLIISGADPNKRDSIQNTPLHLAACSHNLAIITLLITAGADVDSQDMHGRHPLQLARSKLQILQRFWLQGHIEMTKLKTEVKDVRNIYLFQIIYNIFCFWINKKLLPPSINAKKCFSSMN